MNTYYLKKFREKAYEKFGIRKNRILDGHYVVIYRLSGIIHCCCDTLESAIQSLYAKRRDYILELLEKERRRKIDNIDEINKQLAKL